MGYDLQRSPFATRLFLTCYCLFLLVNILLYSNNICRIKKCKSEFETIILCFISLLIFFISFYGLWFANILILCLIILLFLILLGTTLISILLIIFSNKIFLLKTSLYFSHNYIWLIKSSTYLLLIINLSLSFILNLIALWGLCHLCSCIEHQYWSYRKKTTQNIIL